MDVIIVSISVILRALTYFNVTLWDDTTIDGSGISEDLILILYSTGNILSLWGADCLTFASRLVSYDNRNILKSKLCF